MRKYDMTFSSRSSGNAFLYILISVLLLGALSFAISRGNDSNPSGEISDAQAKAAATSILAYESQARTAIDQMIQNGTNVANIDFDTLPSSASFNTAPTINKLFHPDGGGLQWKPLPTNSYSPLLNPKNGYYIGMFNNTAWTPTSANDVLFTAFRINKNVCAALNYKITGSKTIPNLVGSKDLREVFVSTSVFAVTKSPLDNSSCLLCNGAPSMCVSDIGPSYVYYSILVGR